MKGEFSSGDLAVQSATPTDRRSSRNALMSIACSAVIAVIALAMYARTTVAPEDFALGKENSHSRETFNAVPFTASSASEMRDVAAQAHSTLCDTDRDARRLVWIGNSQLHTINQYQAGQHLAPHWLRALTKSPQCFVPLGFSLPNANFQEYAVVATYATRSLHVGGVLLSLVFDDLREDDLRADLADLLTSDVRADLSRLPTGKDMLARFDQQKLTSKKAQENVGLEGFVQKKFEDELTQELAAIFPLWAKRPSLRVELLTDLYFLRNKMLGITPSTTRRMLPAPYARNMAALTALVENLRGHGIPVIMYVAPIRQDAKLPYDPKEYAKWKLDVEQLAEKNSATFLNLERLVPDTLWGTYHEADIDFMHFQGEGHRLLANALVPAVRKAVGGL